MRIIATLTDAASIRRYLEGVGLPVDPPTIAPARPRRNKASTSPPEEFNSTSTGIDHHAVGHAGTTVICAQESLHRPHSSPFPCSHDPESCTGHRCTLCRAPMAT